MFEPELWTDTQESEDLILGKQKVYAPRNTILIDIQ